jgi:hypothetical protein
MRREDERNVRCINFTTGLPGKIVHAITFRTHLTACGLNIDIPFCPKDKRTTDPVTCKRCLNHIRVSRN